MPEHNARGNIARMNVHIRVERDEKENNMSLLRRFRTRVMEWGGMRRVRSIRYATRAKSPYVEQKSRLKAIGRKEERERLYKLGLIDRV